ncbi:MAG: VOC family protein [Actinomycetes bacterium]
MANRAAETLLSHVNPSQISILVPDIETGIRVWSALLGRRDWRIYTYTPDRMPALTYRGAPGRFSMRLALVGENPQIELLQPIAGPSIYHEWVAEHGYGPHHVGFYVDSIDALITEATAAGIGILQTGKGYGVCGDGGFAYLDTLHSHGVILEAIEVPLERMESDPIPEALWLD